jgi:uncharacterized protein (TIGR02271 family)
MSILFMGMGSSIEWDDVIKKEARGSNDDDLGEVQEIGQTYVVTQKGTINKQKFYIPKYLAEGYDGNVLRFRLTEQEAKSKFVRDTPPSAQEYSRYKTSDIPKDIETRIPVMGERLDVSKRTSTREATITKEPISEKKTLEVPVTHEEATVERRPAGETVSTSGQRPVESRTEVKVPLKSEEVQVTKQPYVKEEVAVKKKPVTETRTVTDEVKSEKVNVSGTSSDEE